MLRVGILWQYHVSIPCEGTHMTVPRVGASRARTLAVPCVLTPQLPPCAIPHLTPDTLSILSLLACHPLLTRLSSLSRRTFHPFVVSTPALSNLATFPLATCALKRFPLTSPRKLALTCVKRPVLRTSGWTSLGSCDEAVMMHCLFLPKISIFGHENAGLV